MREVCAQGFDARARQLRPVYGSTRPRRQPADDPAGRLPAAGRPAVRGHASRRSSSELTRRRLRAALPDTDDGGRRPAARRGRVPRLHVLAGRQPGAARARATRPASCSSGCWRCATTSACSRRSTTRGRPAGGQLPAGVLARRADQHGAAARAALARGSGGDSGASARSGRVDEREVDERLREVAQVLACVGVDLPRVEADVVASSTSCPSARTPPRFGRRGRARPRARTSRHRKAPSLSPAERVR